MESIYLLEAVGSALPASFPGTWAPSAETVEFNWLAKSLADLGCLIRSRKSFTMPPFFDLFAAVDESWSAMEM